MNRTHSTDNIDNSVKRAEQEVHNSLQRFETAMEHLAEKVEGPGQALHKVQATAQKAKRKVQQVTDMIHHATGVIQHNVVDPVRPYLKPGDALSGRAISQVQGNPNVLIWAAVGLVGGLTVLMYLRRKNTWAGKMATQVVRDSAKKFLSI